MLLASAPPAVRPVRQRIPRWPAACALALLVALGAPAPAGAQDGTTYVGGGGSADGRNVIVNMDAIDGGRGRAPRGTRRGGTSGGAPDGTDVRPGEPYRSPTGALLRFPPVQPPQSRLTMDPSEIGDGGPRRAEAPSRRPERKPATAAAQPSAEESQTARRTPERTREPEPDRRPTAEAEAAPAATPGRKPEPPEAPTRTAAAEPQRTPETKPSTPASGDRQAGGQPAASGETQQARTLADNAAEDMPDDVATSTGDAASGTDGADAPAPPEPDTQTAAATDATDADGATDRAGNTQPADGDGGSDAATGGTETAQTQTAQTQTAQTQTAGTATGDTGSDAGDEADADETQTAALPEGGALPERMRLRFDDGSAQLGAEAKKALDRLAATLNDNPRQRVQLMAFAEGTEDTASQARRLSLSRALAVRTYLIDKGIRSTRMDVRALGATAEQGPLDRVDIVPARR
jgi:outer membrane protein OmpA-like peptidoglycan-associated protein